MWEWACSPRVRAPTTVSRPPPKSHDERRMMQTNQALAQEWGAFVMRPPRRISWLRPRDSAPALQGTQTRGRGSAGLRSTIRVWRNAALQTRDPAPRHPAMRVCCRVRAIMNTAARECTGSTPRRPRQGECCRDSCEQSSERGFRHAHGRCSATCRHVVTPLACEASAGNVVVRRNVFTAVKQAGHDGASTSVVL